MNRLVIVGNGFDLAHGLPTSYSHFIDDFWRNFSKNYKNEEYAEIIFVNEQYYGFLDYSPINNFNELKKNLVDYSEEYSHRYSDKNCTCYTNDGKPIFYFKNQFLFQINYKKAIENWVDIENEYYDELKRIVHFKSLNISESEVKQVQIRKEKIVKLNREFNQIKILLEKYLFKNVNDRYSTELDTKNNNWIRIYNILKPISLFNNENKLLDEFFSSQDRDVIMSFFRAQKADLRVKKQLRFLNFNYTPTLLKYLNPLIKGDLDVNIIHIHGEINDKKNQFNFGYGDEMDEDYKLIENINDNEYLENFKSFQYFQGSNYKELLDYINSDKFQVYIMGHSCGLSDRTLLNTIFEHDNCCSIKIYYHDNYTDIVQNMSRHFNDKKKMRNKIVNKSLCQPFPQDVGLPLKEDL